MESSGEGTPLAQYRDHLKAFTIQYQKLLDESTPWLKSRWGVTAALFTLYVLRVTVTGGWYIISYALAIYILNLLIGFLSPQIDPELEDGAGTLPSAADDEYKPFIRRLPEFKFWFSITRACVIALFCTFFSFLDIPVYYPILVLYFIALFAVTMRKQIQHMIKYKYIPMDFGKPKFNNK